MSFIFSDSHNPGISATIEAICLLLLSRTGTIAAITRRFRIGDINGSAKYFSPPCESLYHTSELISSDVPSPIYKIPLVSAMLSSSMLSLNAASLSRRILFS